MLLRPSDRSFLERVCQREKCPVDFVGNITGDGKVRFSLDGVDGCTSAVLPASSVSPQQTQDQYLCAPT